MSFVKQTMKTKKIPFNEIILMVAIAGIVGLIIYGASVGSDLANDKAIELLESNGYSNIELLGYDPFAGSEGDRNRIRFRAVNANGREIEGAVTGDDFKGWTIRLF